MAKGSAWVKTAARKVMLEGNNDDLDEAMVVAVAAGAAASSMARVAEEATTNNRDRTQQMSWCASVEGLLRHLVAAVIVLTLGVASRTGASVLWDSSVSGSTS